MFMQREAHEYKTLSEDRSDFLNSINFPWDFKALHEEKIKFLDENPNECPGYHFASKIGKAKVVKLTKALYDSIDQRIDSVADKMTNGDLNYANMGSCDEDGNEKYNEPTASQTRLHRNPSVLQPNGEPFKNWHLEYPAEDKIYARVEIIYVVKTSTEALIGERYIMDYIHKNYPHLLSLNQGHYGGNKDPKGMDLHYFGLTVFYNVKKAIKRGRAAFSADMTPELKTKVKEVYKGEPEVQKFVQPCKKIKDAVTSANPNPSMSLLVAF